MPFTDKTHAVAFELILTGQLHIHEAARLARVSRQGIYRTLPKDVDLIAARERHARKVWQQAMKNHKFK